MLSPIPEEKKPSREEVSDPHPSYGLNAKRSCTDVPCLMVFVIFAAVWVYLATLVFKQGDPNKLLYGIDQFGNNCGHGSPNVSVSDWSARVNIWYPVSFSGGSASLDSTVSMGICVATCPSAGTILTGYAAAGTPQWQIPRYVVLYDSFPVLHRCVPNASAILCSTGLCGGSPASSPGTSAPMSTSAPTTTTVTTTTAPAPANTTSAAPSSNPVASTTTSLPATTSTSATSPMASNTTTTAAPISSSSAPLTTTTTTAPPQTPTPATTTAAPASTTTFQIGGIGALRNLADSSLNDLVNSWWVILVGAIVAVLVSFFWLAITRRMVKPLVVITTLLLLALLVVGGVLCYVQRNKSLDDPASDTDTPKYWLAGAIAFWVVAFLFLCVVLFLFRDAMTACDIIEEASKVPIKIPTMVVVPLICFILTVPFLIWTVFIGLYAQTCGDTLVLEAPNVTIPMNLTAQLNFTAAKLQLTDWRIPVQLFNLFMFLWVFGILNAVCFVTIALCAVYWYFSEPGDHKSPPTGSVGIAVCAVVRNHLGTIFLGAFIVAVIQILRVILLVVEKKISERLRNNPTVKGILACLHCFLACLERLMKFINKNAYIVMAIEGSNFISSAQRALQLLLGNALTVGAITVISEYVMIFSKLMITAISTLVVYGILKARGGNDSLTSGILILVIAGVFAFFISCLFINIFSVCIDTILLCYCVDKDAGNDKHYYPSDLEAHVAKQSKKATAAPVGLESLNKTEPLLTPLPKGKELDLL